MHLRSRAKKIGAAASLLTAAAVAITVAVPANADTAARSADVVGVGSDTIQNVADFLFDGAPGVAGGYNNLGNTNRALNFFATGDANGRAVYDGDCGTTPTGGTGTGLAPLCTTSSSGAPESLPGTVILRDGTDPVVRPNGSGAGAAALTQDGTTGYQGLPKDSIQFARMSRLPNSTEETNCSPTTSGCGGLHVYQIATDGLQIAHTAKGYNGPSALSADELYNIFVTCKYTTWNQLPGNTNGSSDTIHPLIPQSGSGSRVFFLADLQAAEGLSSTLTPGTCTRTVEEHDPTGIYQDATPGDAIEPFSAGKLSLINSGYFQNAGYTGASGNAYTPNYLSLLPGGSGATAPDGEPGYDSTRGLYIVLRQDDLADTTPFQTGSTQNWASTLFVGSDSYAARAANAALIKAAGFTPAYKDCGVNPTSC